MSESKPQPMDEDAKDLPPFTTTESEFSHFIPDLAFLQSLPAGQREGIMELLEAFKNEKKEKEKALEEVGKEKMEKEKEKMEKEKEKMEKEKALEEVGKEKRKVAALEDFAAKRQKSGQAEFEESISGKSSEEMLWAFKKKLEEHNQIRADRTKQPDPKILDSSLDTTLPLLNREVTFDKIFLEFQTVWENTKDVKKGVTCLAGGRGAGKTRTLFEICQLGQGLPGYVRAESYEAVKDIPKFLFIPITFNNLTRASELDKDPRIAVACRLLYTYFCDINQVSWADFQTFFSLVWKSITLDKALVFIQEDMVELGKYSTIVVLVDETKAGIDSAAKATGVEVEVEVEDLLGRVTLKNNTLEGKDRLSEITKENVHFDQLLSAFENLLPSAKFEGKLHFVVTSLSFKLFHNVSKSLSVHHLNYAKLTPLRDEDVLTLGKPIFQAMEANTLQKPNISRAKKLLLESNGLPRLVSVFLRALDKANKDSTLQSNFLLKLRSDLRKNEMQSFFVDKLRSPELWGAIALAIIGREYRPDEVDVFIQIGMILPGSAEDPMTPTMSPLVLWFLAHEDQTNVSEATAQLLKLSSEIVDAGGTEIGKRLEQQFSRLLVARILCYHLFPEGKLPQVLELPNLETNRSISLQQLFRLRDTIGAMYPALPETQIVAGKKKGKGKAGDTIEEGRKLKKGFADLKLKFTGITQIQCYEDNHPSFWSPPLTSKVLYPESPLNPGIDLWIDGISDTNENWVIAVQMKESKPGSTTTLSMGGIVDMLAKTVGYHPWVAEFIENGRFYLVVISLRETTKELVDGSLWASSFNDEIEKIKGTSEWKLDEISKLFPAKEGANGKEFAIETVFRLIKKAISQVVVLGKEDIEHFFTPTFSHHSA